VNTAALSATPRRLSALFVALDPELHRVRPDGHGFAFSEHLWHLADLETEAFQVRLRRMLEEDAPFLPDFDGAAAARSRDYLALDPAEGLRRFTAARARTLEAFSRLREAEWGRIAEQQGMGVMSLAELPGRILAHDQAHLCELRGLLAALRREPLQEILGNTTTMEDCA
jgi:hypothetical protein